ncbi:TPA: ribosomal-processing cysteine protease Prp [bacterium]|nr:ribosomal-processing cysteine protease Prp [bacterium]
MISMEIKRDKRGRIVFFRAKGHSGYKKKGEDIVCAGVSAILQTTLLGLSKHLNMRLDVIKEEGYLEVKILDEPLSTASSILEAMLLGLLEIKDKYPKYLEIIQI